MILLGNLFGTQNYQGDFHYNGFTEITLKHLLEEAGFKIQSLTIKDEWLFHVLAVKVTHKCCHPMYLEPSEEGFLRKAFEIILQREVDPGGLAFYTEILSTGIPRESVAQALYASDEYRALKPPIPG